MVLHQQKQYRIEAAGNEVECLEKKTEADETEEIFS